MTFICDGAVSGNWWNGPYQECPQGYGLFDVWPDGSFRHRYISYRPEYREIALAEG